MLSYHYEPDTEGVPMVSSCLIPAFREESSKWRTRVTADHIRLQQGPCLWKQPVSSAPNLPVLWVTAVGASASVFSGHSWGLLQERAGVQVFGSSDWEATYFFVLVQTGGRAPPGLWRQTAGFVPRMDHFNFGNSILDHLARGCWGTKRGGGVNHTSVWMGLCALAMLCTSSKQWQCMKIRCAWLVCIHERPLGTHLQVLWHASHPEVYCKLSSRQSNSLPWHQHPLQHLLHSSWPFKYVARQLLKNPAPSMV